ncbi:MAG: ATP-binding protein [Thermincola sp.]|jgi:signal transduction histidine kinase|nr:ATP-binding protein [Thermincola sp.]MDT3702364.1 ATP-binding protein [Thermincola sp.]
MWKNLRKTLRFQIGAIISVILAILLMAFISMHMVSVKYDREVLADKQEKLGVITHGLSKGIVTFIGNGESTVTIKGYFENQAEGMVKTNPRMIVGLYLPSMGIQHFYGDMTRSNRIILYRKRSELREDDEFFNVKVSAIRSPRNFMDNHPGGGGPLLGRAEPVIVGNEVLGAVLAAERVQPGLTVFRTITKVVFFAVPVSLIGGILAMAFLLTRLKRGVRQVTNGLASLEKDAGYRLTPPVSGELGEISLAINNMADAVEEKALLEEQLERSSHLASLGRLVAGVAHEIRNPLGIMKATVQVMQDDFREQEQLEEYLKVLNEQIDRQNKIIRELLDYAKPVPPIFQTVDVNDIVKSLFSFAKSYFQQHNVEADFQPANDLPPVKADVEKLKQAFLNLIFNSVEAMPEGGQITVRTALKDDFVVLEFFDNGRGIPENDISKLFDPFFTTKNTGTGLGLAIVHNIIELHHGKTEVQSKPGEGAVFRITLPIAEREE